MTAHEDKMVTLGRGNTDRIDFSGHTLYMFVLYTLPFSMQCNSTEYQLHTLQQEHEVRMVEICQTLKHCFYMVVILIKMIKLKYCHAKRILNKEWVIGSYKPLLPYGYPSHTNGLQILL